jgi:chromate transporter
VSFGGPAGQIAILHREIVERRRWLQEHEFTGALNFCMLLLGLPWLHARHGSLPAVSAVLFGLKAAALALVLQALLRIGRRALNTRLHLVLAIAAFATLELLHVPFPLIVLAAGLVGFASAWRASRPMGPTMAQVPDGAPLRVAVAGIVLWMAPLLTVALTPGPGSLWSRVYLFFTQAALVTFGGAYAVLGYVAQVLVGERGWVTAQQSMDGLALAETTPGPLVIVLQFMGFMAGWNEPAPLSPAAAAGLAAVLASWATFLPSFVFIFLGAPYVDRLSRLPRASAALAAITAAVVGIIATLLMLLSRVVILPDGFAGPERWAAVALVAILWFVLERGRLELHWVLLIAAVAGPGLQALGFA